MASIYKRGRVWWVCYMAEGEKVCKNLKTKDAEIANALKLEIELQLARKLLKAPKKLTLKKAVKDYLEDIKHTRAANTVEGYRIRLGKLTAKHGEQSLASLDARKINAFLNGVIETSSPGNAASYRRAISAFFTYACDNDLISANPMPKVIRIKNIQQRQVRAFSNAEIKQIMSGLDNDAVSLIAYLGLYAGLRISETMRLEWQDVDFEKNLLNITKTKNYTPRAIPLHRKLRAFLNKRRKKAGRLMGRINDKYHAQKLFYAYLKKLKIKNAGTHTLRHTFITLLMAEVDRPAIVQQLAGHKNIQTTMKYSHVQPNRNHVNMIKI